MEREEINFLDFLAWVKDTQREPGTKGFYEQHDGKTYRQLLQELHEEVEADPENRAWDEVINAKEIRKQEQEEV